MKILFAYDYPESGTESVLKAVAKALRPLGHVVDEIVTDGGRLSATDPAVTKVYLGHYDVAHFWNIRSYIPFADRLDCPFGITIHGFVRGAEEPYFTALHKYEPDYIHCMDSFTQQRLGQQRLFAFKTPQSVCLDGFKPLPPPEEFTLGCTGDIPDFDGFDILEQIGQRTGIRILCHNASQRWIPHAKMGEEFYSKISVYGSWTFGACGPITAQEAMACGRPVLATRSETMEQVMADGLEGKFFDGSAEDGAKKLKLIQADYQNMAKAAPSFRPNDPLITATTLLAKWESLV